MVKFKNRKLKIALIIACDFLALALSIYLSVIITGQGWDKFVDLLFWACLNVTFMYVIYSLFNLYSFIFSSVSINDVLRCFISVSFVYALDLCCVFLVKMTTFSTATIMCLFLFAFCLIIRFSKKIILNIRDYFSSDSNKIRVMIISINTNCQYLINQMSENRKLLPVCILDDNSFLQANRICGVKIVSTLDGYEDLVKKYKIDRVIIYRDEIESDRYKEIKEKIKTSGITCFDIISVDKIIK